jgi:streptomycin 6-kinase
VAIAIPETLARECTRRPESAAWLASLPEAVSELAERWQLTLEPPFDGDNVGAWVAPGMRADGSLAVLKLGLPHMEAEHEAAGLGFWDGDPTVRLLERDDAANALLLERCVPGTPLRALPEPEQDVVLAAKLRRLWRVPPAGHPFRPLAEMADYWASETEAAEERWADPALVREGVALWRELPASAPDEALLATDLHAGNILRAEREEWLVIDPKPFFGDRHYDVTQHFFNCERRHTEPLALVERLAGLLDLDATRVRLWCFTRAAAEEYNLDDLRAQALARALAP